VSVAVGKREFPLRLAADGADELDAQRRGPLSEEQTDAARGRMEQASLPRLQR
jgi:hypothetical protein